MYDLTIEIKLLTTLNGWQRLGILLLRAGCALLGFCIRWQA